MKWLLRAAFLLVLASFGCVSQPKQLDANAQRAGKADSPPPVTANQITRDNAYVVSQSLWNELEREAQAEPTSSTDAKTSPSKK